MKIVVFDCDGTITPKGSAAWNSIRVYLGLDDKAKNFYSYIYKKFRANEITYQQWCEITCKYFKSKNFTYHDFLKATKNNVLINGASETFKTLTENGYNLHILSGGIKQHIINILGDNRKYFDDVSANEFIFDENNLLSGIVCTKYDFETKKDYIENIKQKYNLKASDIYFIGNSFNDEWVALSGCNTICFNPTETSIDDSFKWNYVIHNSDTLTDILTFVLNKNKQINPKIIKKDDGKLY